MGLIDHDPRERKQLRIRARNARLAKMYRDRDYARDQRDSFRRQMLYVSISIVMGFFSIGFIYWRSRNG